MRGRRAWRLVWALVAAGCGSGGETSHPSPDAAASDGDGGGSAASHDVLRAGSRLRPRFQVERGAIDAEGLLVGWHDEQLAADCVFVRDADGVYRCLPGLGRGGLVVFSTPDCQPGTGLVGTLTPDQCEPGYVWHGFEATGCGERTSGTMLRVLGPATASNATHPYVLSVFGACNPLSSDAPRRTYCTYEEVDSSAFVAASEEIVEAGGVRVRLLRGEDGSVAPHELLHPDFDQRLMRDTWSGATLIAEGPQWGELPEVYLGPECSNPVLCFPHQVGDSPLDPVVAAPTECVAAVVVQSDACSGASYELGDAVDDAMVCGEPAGDEPRICYAQQRVLPDIAYAERALGEGRLRSLWMVQGGEPILPTAYFYDEELETSCWVTEVGGEPRCSPADPVRELGLAYPGAPSGWKEQFADEACETSLGFAYLPKCGETAPAVGSLLERGLVRMRPTEAPSGSPTYSGFSPSPGFVIDCMPNAAPPAELFAPEPIAPDDLAAIEEVVR